MRTTKTNSPAPFNTQAAAVAIGCSIATLRAYVKRGEVVPQRTPSGRLIFFDREIAQARELFERNRQR